MQASLFNRKKRLNKILYQDIMYGTNKPQTDLNVICSLHILYNKVFPNSSEQY